VIAGAGPAGLTLAAALIAEGTPVDRIVVHESITESAATSTGAFLGLSPALFEHLAGRVALPALTDLFVCSPRIDAIRLVRPDGADVTRPLPAPLRMVTRQGLVAALLDGVRGLGIDIRFESPIRQPGAMGAWLIGADGVHSSVRRSAGFDHLPAPVAPGISARFAPRYDGPAPDLALHVLTFFQGGGGSAIGFLTGPDGALAFSRYPDGMAYGDLGFRLDTAILDAVDAQSGEPIRIWELGLPDRAPGAGSPWRSGRSVLIGDAAHAKSPASGSGAADAITDALHLAPALHMGSVEAVNAALDELFARERGRRASGSPR
jgi:2-polyprenyl-6-methoxyphenol hydroxylase-like FAD-dependent oxidoreductase